MTETEFAESPLCREPGCHRQRRHAESTHYNIFAGVSWIEALVIEDRTTGEIRRQRR